MVSGNGGGYLDRLRSGQAGCLNELKAIAASSALGSDAGVAVTEVPWLDAEARTVPRLRALGAFLLR